MKQNSEDILMSCLCAIFFYPDVELKNVQKTVEIYIRTADK
jgi:hypothetical protein